MLEKLKAINCLLVINEENVDIAWKRFAKLFLDVIDHIAPIKTVRLKHGCEPWFSGEILKLISRRHKAWVKFRKSKSDESHSDYKLLRNLAQFSIKKAKKDFVINQIKENQNAPKTVWKILKNLGMPSKSKRSLSNIGLRNDSDEMCLNPNLWLKNSTTSPLQPCE